MFLPTNKIFLNINRNFFPPEAPGIWGKKKIFFLFFDTFPLEKKSKKNDPPNRKKKKKNFPPQFFLGWGRV